MKCVKCGHDPEQPVGERWEFVINRDPPSLNQRIFNSGTRAHVYRKERETWGWEIRAARVKHRVSFANSSQRRRVTFTRLYAGRQQARDVDNLAGGMKAIVDSLVLEKILIDDGPAFAELHYGQERLTATDGRQKPGLRITIEVLDNAAASHGVAGVAP